MDQHVQLLYQKVLGITVDGSSPNFYALLKLSLFETDGSVIHEAALTQISALKQWEIHPDPQTREAVHDMISLVSNACTVLEVEARKSAYDADLAQQMGITLERSSDEALTNEVQLHKCPSCGNAVSELTIICIDCGYNFETQQTLETTFEETTDSAKPVLSLANPADTAPPGMKYTESVATFASTLFRGLYKAVMLIFVLTVIAAALYLSYLFMGDAVLKKNYTFTSDYRHGGRIKSMVDSSPEWQKVFAKHNKKGKTPIHFNLVWGEGGNRNKYQCLTLTVYLEKKQIYKGTATFKKFDHMLERMQTRVDAAADAVLKQDTP